MSLYRPATPEDADAIAALKVQCWQHDYRGLLPQQSLDGLDAADEAPHWRNWLEDRDSGLVAMVAEQEGALLGYGLAGPMRLGDRPGEEIDADGELYALYSHPDHQRRGLGRRLLLELIEGLQGKGYRTVGLWVLGGNSKADAFFAKWGAQDAGKRVQIHHGRIAFRERAWLWPDIAALKARLSLKAVE